ncbi:MAG: MerR family transcriptional regulator [Hyphomonadaceae bacterium]|nr:MerR family transcriptional regulator [Hyphomonadaceae bacterium]
MTRLKTYKVKDVALIAGVSVRTLHYYDEIGLLVPSGRSGAGYRLYDENDLLRLQQILIGRSLGLALEEIRLSLDDEDFDYAQSLRQQRAQLVERLGQTHKMINAVDSALTNLGEEERELDLTVIFDGFDPVEFESEVAQRWGETNAYAESARRTKNYSDADWALIKSELDQIWDDAAQAMRQETPPDSYVALDIIERHRKHICRWFYDLSPELHVQLASLWEADERFRSYIDKHGDGLTAWLVSSVRAAGDAI